eukprot:6675387-Pyramimonas_sp.AAC.1
MALWVEHITKTHLVSTSSRFRPAAFTKLRNRSVPPALHRDIEVCPLRCLCEVQVAHSDFSGKCTHGSSRPKKQTRVSKWS